MYSLAARCGLSELELRELAETVLSLDIHVGLESLHANDVKRVCDAMTGWLAARPPAQATEIASPQQTRLLFALLRDAQIFNRHSWASAVLGRQVVSYKNLSKTEVSSLINAAQGVTQIDGLLFARSPIVCS